MSRKILLIAWFAALALFAPATASAAVDIGLVVDGSGSIDGADWQLQREGFSAALRDPANVPLDGSVAITVVQFSSGTQVEVPRTLIDSKEKLDGVVAKIEAMQQRQGGTDPDSGIDAATEALKPYRDGHEDRCSACPRTAPAATWPTRSPAPRGRGSSASR